MNLIDKQLNKIKTENRLGLMTHLIVGYPTLDETIKLVKIMEDKKVDFIELQIPFSDPLADGPTIMKACEYSLKQGTKVKDAFKVAKILSSQVSVPLLFMAYFNTVFKYDVEQFCKDAKDVGISGLIVPDMSIDEESNEQFFKFCKKYDLVNIQVISPASTKERLRKNAKFANGFIYCTAHQGITGVKENLNLSVANYLKSVKSFFQIPIAVGFGISKREHIERLSSLAEVVVVGSAIVDVINSSRKGNLEKNIGNFINDLKSVNIHP